MRKIFPIILAVVGCMESEGGVALKDFEVLCPLTIDHVVTDTVRAKSYFYSDAALHLIHVDGTYTRKQYPQHCVVKEIEEF